MAMLNELLFNFDADRCDLNDLVELAAFGRAYRVEFEQLGLDIPDRVDQQLKVLRREIRGRTADALEKSLREKRARREALGTPEEKRKKLEEEIAALEAKLQQA